ncbi:MAG: transposase [Verrucomicrobiaceae bacterium]|nr:MAG: transposase [Verrucomicrobiaceae bacterium]
MPAPAQRSDREIGEVIEKILKVHRGRYGCRRLGAELDAMGLTCAPERVRRIMSARPQSPSAQTHQPQNQ